MTAFRVYFIDGDALRIVAPTPEAARKVAADRRPSLLITKIKKIKDGSEVEAAENA